MMTMKILITLFEKAVSNGFAHALSERGHTTMIVAVNDLRAQLKAPPDLLFFDYASADVEFLHLIKNIKDAPSTATIKILAANNAGTLGEMEKLFLCGVDECVTRPFTIDDVISKIEKLSTANNPAKTVSIDNTIYNQVPEALHKRVEEIRDDGRLLGDIAEIYTGVAAQGSRGHRLLCPSSDWSATLTEKSVEAFFVNPEREYYLFRKNAVKRIPETYEYNVAEKVLVRRIMSPLVAALDTTRLPFSSDLFGIVTVKGLDPGYLACIFNSRLANFYFHRYRPPASGVHGVYFSRLDLEALPIIIVKPREQAVLTNYAHQLATIPPQTKNDEKKLLRNKILTEMNKQLFKIYGFTDDEVKLLGTLHY